MPAGAARKGEHSNRHGFLHCSAVPRLPRTTNGLKDLFGFQRGNIWRAAGRTLGSRAAVLRAEFRPHGHFRLNPHTYLAEPEQGAR